MNQLSGISLKKMSVKDLRLTIAALHPGGDVSRWPKEDCVNWLEKHHIHQINVGNLCKTLLRVVVRKNEEGFPVGLSHHAMFVIVKKHFPQSAVNERHFSWYATTMRAAGEVIPVYRE